MDSYFSKIACTEESAPSKEVSSMALYTSPTMYQPSLKLQILRFLESKHELKVF